MEEYYIDSREREKERERRIMNRRIGEASTSIKWRKLTLALTKLYQIPKPKYNPTNIKMGRD